MGIGDWLNLIVLFLAYGIGFTGLAVIVVRLARRRTPEFPESDGEHL